MSIKLRGYKLNIKNWILTVASVFAFVLSPFYGVVADYVAHAAGSHVVTATDSQNWKFITTGDATGSYSTQPSTQLLGAGSYEMKSTSGMKGYLYDTSYNGRALNSFSELGYSYFVANRNAGTSVAPSLSLITTINGTWTELKVEPTYTNNAPAGSWQTIDAFAPTTKWYSTKTLYTDSLHTTIAVNGGDAVANMVPWSTLVALDPTAKLGSDDGASGVRLTFGQNSGGSPWSNFVAYVDKVEINDNTYNFEVPTPVKNISTGEEFTTIQAALDDTDTVNGNTIVVDPGTYSEDVTVSKSVTIDGAQAGNDARSGRSNIANESVVNGQLKITADDVTIDGFTVTGANPIDLNRDSGTTHNTNETIKNNIINVNGGRGIDINSDNSTISQNKFNLTNGFAVWASNQPWHNMSIVNNSISGSSYLDMNFVGSYSYDATNTVNAPSTNIAVSGNISDTHTSNFLMSTFIDGFTISNNTISNKTGNAIVLGGNNKNVSITGNTISTTSNAVRVYQYVDTGHPDWPAWPVNGKITISDNDFSGSKNGVNVAPGSVDTTNLPVNALNNWWGNASGPTDGVSGDGSVPATNPSGTGAAAIGAVKYSIWCTTADCSTVNTPSTPTNFYFNKGQNDTTDRTLVDGSTTNTTPLVGTGSIAGQKYLWTHWDSQPNTVYHIETAFQKNDGSWKNLHTSNNSKPEPYRFYGFGSEGNGLYRMKVTAYSTLNGLKSSPATVYLSYDTQSPVAYFSPDFANNSFVNSNFHVSGVANDNVKLKNVIFDIRDPQDTTGNAYRAGCVGSSNLLYTNSQKDASLNCDMNISNLVEGHQYIVRIHASDFAGYGGGESRTFTVDKTAPVIEIDGQAPKSKYNLSDGLSVHVVENNLDYVDVDRIDSKAPNNDKHWKYTGNWFGLSWLKDGEYRLTAHDKAGNTTVITFITDRTKSHVDANSTSETNPDYNPASFTITATDDIKAGWFNTGVEKIIGNIYQYDASQSKYVLSHSNSSTSDNPYTVNLGGLGNGNYYVLYNAKDGVGNTSNTEKYYFVVDHVAPTVTVLSPSDGEVIGGLGNDYKVTVKLKIDDGAGVNLDSKYTWVAFGNGVALKGSVTADSSKYALHHEAGDPTDVYTVVIDTTDFVAPLHNSGTYNLTVRAQDVLGNGSSHKYYTGAAHHGTKLTVDNNRTNVALTSPANNSYQDDDFIVAGTASDPETSIDHVSIFIAHSPWSAGGYVVDNQLAVYDPIAKTFSYDATNIPDGTYTVKAFAYDQNGNVQSVSNTITVDTIAPDAPVLSVTGLNSGGVTNQYSITATWTKPSDDTVKYEYQYWNDIPANQWKETHPYSVIVTSQSRTGDFTEGEGVHHLRVRAIDAAGNVSDWSNVFDITYDKTAPIVGNVIVQDSNRNAMTGTIYNPSFVVTTGNTDNGGSGIATTHTWVYDATTNQKVLGLFTQGSTNLDYWLSKNLAILRDSGSYYLDVWTVDKAGNESAHKHSATFTLDHADPVISLTTPTTTVSAADDSPVTITYSVNDDNLNNYQLTINGAAVLQPAGTANIIDGTYSWDLTGLADGDYVVTLTAADKAGNTATTSATVTVDNTAPQGFTAGINTDDGTSTGRTFSGTTEPGATVDIEVHSTVQTDSVVADANGDWTLTFNNLEVGDHEAVVTSTDPYGNTTAPITIPFTVEKVVNTLLTPGRGGRSQTVSTAANNAPVIATFAAPTTTGGNTATPSVLGAQDTKDSGSSDVKGASDTKKDTNTCYKIFGICWYWWILILVVVGLIIWWIVAKKRKNDK